MIRRSKTWRKLVSVTWVVGVNFFGGVFGLYLFLANLPLNMLVTLDSNFFHENLLEKNQVQRIENLDGTNMIKRV